VGYGAFFLLLRYRNTHFPPALITLGKLSFSIYLVHGLLLQANWPHPYQQVLFVLIGTSLLAPITYKFIELPGISAGKHLIELRRAQRLANRSQSTTSR
jgi:peptidoglycan/LPS O-acetylase OafA/YrhL